MKKLAKIFGIILILFITIIVILPIVFKDDILFGKLNYRFSPLPPLLRLLTNHIVMPMAQAYLAVFVFVGENTNKGSNL